MSVSSFNRSRRFHFLHGSQTASLLDLPDAPSDLVVTAAESHAVLTWTDNSSNEDEFAIFRSTDGASFAELTTVSADVVTYDDTGLTNGQIYYYYVVGRNGDGDSAASNTDSDTPVHTSGLSKTSGSPGWNSGAWSPSFALTGDVDLTVVTMAPSELIFGLRYTAQVNPTSNATTFESLNYGLLCYSTGQFVACNEGTLNFGGQTFITAPTSGVTTLTVKRVGTDILLQSDGVTRLTISGVSAATAVFPVVYGNPVSALIESSTLDGEPIVWENVYGGVVAL